jgi:Domain of unknown function (DUF5666)
MEAIKTASLAVVVLAASACVAAWSGPSQQNQPAAEPTGQTSVTRKIGAIKTINGNTITFAPDSGPEVIATVQESTRIMRIAPGEKTLKNATPIQLQALQVGDRILVGGKASDDGKSIAASSIVMMKISDVETRRQQELRDWQKRGLGGIVSAVDAATQTVTISISGLGSTKSVAVHSSKTTVFRRYAPDSVKFEDAKPSSLQEVHPGDQLRARGDRNSDGTELAAEEIVTGAFRNITGTINSVDAATGTISVQDLLSKKQVQLKVTGDSQLHKLPTEMAQRFAMRMKGAAGIAGVPGSGASPPSATPGAATANGDPGSQPGVSPSAKSPGGSGRGGGMRSGGATDLQQMLSYTPGVALADLHKGDAVVILATEGTSSSPSTAITLVSGVEPILQSVPTASQAMMLAPWSLSAPAGGDAASQ